MQPRLPSLPASPTPGATLAAVSHCAPPPVCGPHLATSAREFMPEMCDDPLADYSPPGGRIVAKRLATVMICSGLDNWRRIWGA